MDETDGTEKLLVDIEEDEEETDDANKPLVQKQKLKPKKSAMKKGGSLRRFPSVG